MATKTIYLHAPTASGSPFFGAVANETAPSATSATSGWTVAKGATSVPHWKARLGVASAVASGAGSASDQISSTTAPQKGTANTISAAGDSFVAGPYSGTFASGSWVFNFRMVATVVSAQAGHINAQVWRGANADGTGATKLTASELIGSTITVTATVANSTVTWSPGASQTFNNEYLFIQVEWQVTTASGSNTANVLFNENTTVANTPTLVTPNFANAYSLAANNGSLALTGNAATANGTSSHQVDGLRGFTPSSFAEVRASVATYFDGSGKSQSAAANIARFDHDPLTLANIGLLIELSATNLTLMSSDMTNGTYWASGGSTLSSLTGPFGNTGCVKVTSNGHTATAVSLGLPSGPVVTTSGSTYTLSYDVQFINRRYVYINRNNATLGSQFICAIFDIGGTTDTTATQTGVGSTSGTIVSTKAKYLGNSWFRISLTGSVNISSSTFAIGFADAATGNSFTSDGFGDVPSTTSATDAFGTGRCQLELGSADTSWISTTTASATRAADAASFTLGGAQTKVYYTFYDGTTFIDSGLTPGSTYTIPTNLPKAWIAYIDSIPVAIFFHQFRRNKMYLRR